MVVGVCGHGYTGSGAVLDFLKEFDECSVPPSADYEFYLTYIPHGIQDLEYHLMKRNARYISSSAAIKEFKKMASILDSPKSVYHIFGGNKFKELSQTFIDSLVQVQWHGYMTYDRILMGSLERTLRFRVLNRLIRLYEKIFSKRCSLPFQDNMYLSVHPKDFYEKVRDYLYNVIECLHYDLKKIVVLNQPFEANDPKNSMKFFGNAKAIVVDRDPRDVYVFVKKFLFSKGSFIPTDNVEDFIRYWRLVRTKPLLSNESEDEDIDILRIQFEDLMYNYDSVSSKIEKFLGLQSKIDNEFKVFNPQKSINNTQLFLRCSEFKQDVEKIEQALPEYLYPFDRYELSPNNNVTPF